MKEIILLIEQDKYDIQNFQDHISELNAEYEVIVEKNFTKAIDKINELISQSKKVVAAFIDIINIDKGQREEPGLKTIAAIKDRFNDIWIVAYTHFGSEYEKITREHGADYFLSKPNLKTILTLKFLKEKIEKHAKEHNLERTQFKDWNVNMLLNILNGIHSSMAHITESKSRHAQSKNVYKINSEYDLQDLLWVVLKPLFPQMTDENPLQKHMGKSSRVDFYIPEINTFIELKYVETESQAKDISIQLDNDVTWYSESNDAKILIFYVLKGNNITYDFEPMKAKLNQKNFKRDSKTWESIICIVRPE